MSEIALNLKYTQAQNKVFWESTARKRIVAKGRRVGFTRGCSQFVIEAMLSGTSKKVLWGDTIHQNIKNYFERYFKPALAPLPKSLWSWHVTDKLFRLGDSFCDFRSADNPENWEGFDYDLVILNEAGIILKNAYLWNNTVAPMLLDNPESICIVGGTPKGKGQFYDLWRMGNSGTFDYESFLFTTYDNPFISKAEIDTFVSELGGSEHVIRQEIFGEFIDNAHNEVFNYSKVIECMKTEHVRMGVEVWGIDVARQGADQSVIAKRTDGGIYEIIKKDTPDLMEFADYVATVYAGSSVKPNAIFVEINGLGSGFFDRLNQLGLPVMSADVSRKSLDNKVFNKRSEMFKSLLNAINKGVALPDDKNLLTELAAMEYSISDGGVFRVSPKETVKSKIGRSPDTADACALSYFAPVIAYTDNYSSYESYDNLPSGAW